MFEKLLKNVREMSPIIHSITNYVTVNDCANILLACGASPIMADDREEVEEITSLCNALVINIGTLNERTIPAMIASGKKANERNIPVIFDPVGVGASRLRTDTAFQLLEQLRFSVIRGNASEINTLCYGVGKTKGVDVNEKDQVKEDNLDQAIATAKQLSSRTKAVIVITGKIDIISDETKTYLISNGHPMMSRITGAGCMLTSVIGAFCAANQENIIKAAAAAVCAMGICGEQAYERITVLNQGTASFRTHLIDAMSQINPKILQERARIKEGL